VGLFAFLGVKSYLEHLLGSIARTRRCHFGQGRPCFTPIHCAMDCSGFDRIAGLLSKWRRCISRRWWSCVGDPALEWSLRWLSERC
jgi:hypothetical protein